jgi:deoxyribose-phosphate aldolase
MSISGATLEDVTLMRKHVSDDVQVKASGGIRDADMFLDMLRQGVTRVGSSSGIAIIEEIKERFFSNGQTHLQI